MDYSTSPDRAAPVPVGDGADRSSLGAWTRSKSQNRLEVLLGRVMLEAGYGEEVQDVDQNRSDVYVVLLTGRIASMRPLSLLTRV